MNITLVNASMGCGGAERVLSIMANYWTEEKKNVSLVTIGTANADFFYLHPGVKRISLDLVMTSPTLINAIINNTKRFKKLRSVILATHPHVLISFQSAINIITLIAAKGLSIPVIVSERANPYKTPIGTVWKMLQKILYPSCDCIVVQTNALKSWAERFVPANKVRVIGNPLAEADLMKKHSKTRFVFPQKYIIAMGRLVWEKGFDLLTSAFSVCPHWEES